MDGRPPVTLVINAGELHCLSGESGSGKTRLLRAIADLDPAQGLVSWSGQSRDSLSAPEWRARVMLVPAQPRWWQDTAEAHFARDMSEAAKILFDKPARLRAPVSELSSGEQSRAALLRALSRDPQVLLLDEPTGALDAASTRAVERLLRQWLSPARAILWISHDLAQIARIADTHWRIDASGLHREALA